MLDGKFEQENGLVNRSEGLNLERFRPELVKIIGEKAVEFVESKGTNWIFSHAEDKFGRTFFGASFERANWFVTVKESMIDLSGDDVPRLEGVYTKGHEVPLINQYISYNKKGVEVAFGLKTEGHTDKAYRFVGDQLQKGSIDFLRDLSEFVKNIQNNVFLYPTDQQRLEVYRHFFTSAKFGEESLGTYFLFRAR